MNCGLFFKVFFFFAFVYFPPPIIIPLLSTIIKICDTYTKNYIITVL